MKYLLKRYNRNTKNLVIFNAGHDVKSRFGRLMNLRM